MLHLLVKLVETKLEERILDDKLRLTVEVHPRQDQEKAHTAWLRDVTTPQGAALHCKYSLAAFDAKAPFYALLTVQDETGANRVASASLDLGPLRINHTAGPVDAQVSLRTPKGAKAFTLQVSASYDGSHDDDLISDNSSEAGEDDVRTGDDPNATDNSSEAEEDDVPADETGKDMNADEKDASALFTDDSSEADEDDVRPGDDVYGTDDSSEASEDDVLEEVPEAESPKAAAAKQNPRQKEQFHSENDSEQSEDDIDDDDDIASDDRQSESYGSASFADAESELKMPLVPTVDTCKESLPLQSEHHSQTSGAWEALYRVDRFESGPGQAKPKVKPICKLV
ncbi:Hypothetical Protein FCC1311_019532 [Hondaea fermentalgiana]|uniref:Uncharacterized protein n=1 Tax=Hondaea fermentalgiana TaxID=2315210 RepID=A0A2R5GD62_9STRA|nr:Hypothetical Protein FCC1311_019532 [Hondaea fermentalgiana]|eukprot:GBG25734.1 Hypothetical Protein FCC1311_019532 [Hondaea fermentalgiana]